MVASRAPIQTRSFRLIRLGSIAALAGGAAWVVKGLAILTTGDQPPLAFQIGVPLFAISLLGLYAVLDRHDRRATAGVIAAGLAISLALAAAAMRVVAPALAPQGEEFTPLSALTLGSALCVVSALVLLGLVSRRSGRLRWRALPFWMGVLLVPGFLAGGALAEIDERLLEVPLVLFAIAWIALGCSMWRSAGTARAGD